LPLSYDVDRVGLPFLGYAPFPPFARGFFSLFLGEWALSRLSCLLFVPSLPARALAPFFSRFPDSSIAEYDGDFAFTTLFQRNFQSLPLPGSFPYGSPLVLRAWLPPRLTLSSSVCTFDCLLWLPSPQRQLAKLLFLAPLPKCFPCLSLPLSAYPC